MATTGLKTSSSATAGCTDGSTGLRLFLPGRRRGPGSLLGNSHLHRTRCRSNGRRRHLLDRRAGCGLTPLLRGGTCIPEEARGHSPSSPRTHERRCLTRSNMASCPGAVDTRAGRFISHFIGRTQERAVHVVRVDSPTGTGHNQVARFARPPGRAVPRSTMDVQGSLRRRK